MISRNKKFTPIKSFYLQKELNKKFWNEKMELDSQVRGNLIKIATDIIDSLDMKIEIEDIVFTGSLANYNWSKYSDVDLHIVIDFMEVNKDFDLVEKYMDSVRKIWNEQHDIKIKGYDVESFIQDVSHKGTPSGQFSILKNKWIIKPSLSNFKPDEDLIKTKASKIMNDIDDLGFDLEHTQNYEKISERFKKIWKRVKESRKSSLEKTGEFSVENLIFKLLRRNGYIGKLLDIRAKAYDYQFSID
jgi:predicted nucleotidyltransferase